MVEEFTDASLGTPLSPRAPCSPHNTILKHSHGETKEVRLSYKYTNQICNLSLRRLCDDVFSLPVFNPKAFHFITFLVRRRQRVLCRRNSFRMAACNPPPKNFLINQTITDPTKRRKTIPFMNTHFKAFTSFPLLQYITQNFRLYNP